MSIIFASDRSFRPVPPGPSPREETSHAFDDRVVINARRVLTQAPFHTRNRLLLRNYSPIVSASIGKVLGPVLAHRRSDMTIHIPTVPTLSHHHDHLLLAKSLNSQRATLRSFPPVPNHLPNPLTPPRIPVCPSMSTFSSPSSSSSPVPVLARVASWRTRCGKTMVLTVSR